MFRLHEHKFSSPPESHEFKALLFDMDGTIIDSTDAIVKYWRQLGKSIDVDGDEILKSSHGRRTIDTLSLWAPDLANWEFVTKEEGTIPLRYGKDAIEIPGSRHLLDKLERSGAPWAIVTSGTRPLVNGWLSVMKLAHPQYLIAAEDVKQGKPDPACYLLGAQRLGLYNNGAEIDPRRVLVLEDAPAGIRAGKAAGFQVVALATTHTIGQLQEAGADWIVQDMRSVTMTGWNPETKLVGIQIKDALCS